MRSLLIAAIVATLFTSTALAESATISLSATGRVGAEPDQGYITAGVSTVAETSAKAVQENTDKMNKLFAALDANGIAKKDFQTVSYTVQQSYKEVPHPTLPNRTTSEPDGFEVSNVVRITVCHLENFGKILDTLTASGANRVNDISFGSSKADEYMKQARALACKEVKEKATELCDGMGVKLFNVTSITEQQQYSAQKYYGRSAAMADAPGGDVPIAGGSLNFQVTVVVTWVIVQEIPQRKLVPQGGRFKPAAK